MTSNDNSSMFQPLSKFHASISKNGPEKTIKRIRAEIAYYEVFFVFPKCWSFVVTFVTLAP